MRSGKVKIHPFKIFKQNCHSYICWEIWFPFKKIHLLTKKFSYITMKTTTMRLGLWFFCTSGLIYSIRIKQILWSTMFLGDTIEKRNHPEHISFNYFAILYRYVCLYCQNKLFSKGTRICESWTLPFHRLDYKNIDRCWQIINFTFSSLKR